jgi:hypothetical protein
LRAIGCFEAVKANGIDTIGIEIRNAKGKKETDKISDSPDYARAILALHADDPSPNVEILGRVERLERNYPVLRHARAPLLAIAQIEGKELGENLPN